MHSLSKHTQLRKFRVPLWLLLPWQQKHSNHLQVLWQCVQNINVLTHTYSQISPSSHSPKHSPHKWTPNIYWRMIHATLPPPTHTHTHTHTHMHTLTESKTVFWRNMWAVPWELSEEEMWRQRETHPDRQRNQITLAAGEGEEKEREREKGKKRERERGKKVGEVWKEEGRGKEGKEEDIVLLECITINEFPDNRK